MPEYCTWRKDKAAEPGYSPELIPNAFLQHYKTGSCTEDSMMCLPKSQK